MIHTGRLLMTWANMGTREAGPTRGMAGKAMATLLVIIAMAAAPPGAPAASPPPSDPAPFVGGPFTTCFWNYGPFGPNGYNIAGGDTNATYWGAFFRRPPGSTLTFRGKFARSRYTSLIAYNFLGQALDALADYQIDPDPKSTNPFRVGEKHRAPKRSFTVNIVDAPNTGFPLSPDSDQAPRNDLYVASPINTEVVNGQQYNLEGMLWRVYVPDRGRDLTGGVGLPEPELTLADGTTLTGQQLCDATDSESKDRVANGLGLRVPNPSSLLIDEAAYTALRYPDRLAAPCNVLAAGCPTSFTVPPALVQVPRSVPETFPGRNDVPDTTVEWRAQYDRRYLLQLWTGDDAPGASLTPPGLGTGGFFPNPHAAYLRAALNRKFGKLAVFHARRPTAARILRGRMGSGELRYFSLCMTESVITTRTQDCVYDGDVPTDSRGWYTIVASRAEDRPKNARKACKVAWVEWPPNGDGDLDPDFGFAQLRNILSDPSFGYAVQNLQTPGDEKAVMGDYLPSVTYLPDAATFERRGCRGAPFN